ncbi:L-histidine N(alpha)-methyltransferase [Parvularcula sp. ZS-1/3]|uniref:L-histidine N(Alpha)-methyltransferase n=1 Tax=Parvularcula mediterranea TaxID=2732508 RepID=A0A7Y3RMR4_9PROT|nr:L-histidine N(alpha)-methyltransferase [Parvularcula mediterranea]
MNEDFLRDVLEGLKRPQPSLPAKWLYDQTGSELFEEITQTDDYYVTRTEAEVMEEVYPELRAICGEDAAIAEFGSGAGIKSRRLIEEMKPSAYVMIDVAEDFLRDSEKRLRADFPAVQVTGVVGDFHNAVKLPQSFEGATCRLGFFPGSTIGNFEEGGAQDFLSKSRETLGDRSRFLVGVDLVKDEDVLLAAYDDDEGVTRRFTKNVLVRMKTELDAEIDLDAFEAIALWNSDAERIELGNLAMSDTEIAVGGERFQFAKGDLLHTENSHKFTEASFTRIAEASGWKIAKMWTDPRQWFGVFLLEAD